MNSLKWKKSNVKFEGSQRSLITAEKKGKYNMDKLKTEYQKISNEFKKESKHDVKIACARHYKNIDKWVSGAFTEAGDDVVLYDVSYNQAYDDDDIDEIQYFAVVNGNEKFGNWKSLRPQKATVTKSTKKSDLF